MAARVAVLMGSLSDREVVAPAVAVLQEFGVAHAWRVLSAHRTPEATAAFVRQAEADGTQVFIAAAGGAAHLAGAVAAQTARPVIGVPVRSPALGGLDSLLSTVQMPPGVPVATVGIDGARNAALLAVAILALGEPRLSQALLEFRRRQAERVLQSDSRISALPPGGAGA